MFVVFVESTGCWSTMFALQEWTSSGKETDDLIQGLFSKNADQVTFFHII